MNGPLTAAEFSRLRKAIQQRDRQLTQGRSTAGADTNILGALRSLSLYLPPQNQLTLVVKDWEGSDQAGRSQIVAWLQQNILSARSPQAAPSQPPREPPSRTNFVSPPPPPPLPTRASTLPIQSNQHVFLSGQQDPAASLHSRTASTSTLGSIRVNPAPVPPRELYTQARFRPPTPPPKDNISISMDPSILGRSSSTRTPKASYQTDFLYTNSPVNETFPNSPTSPMPPTFSPFMAGQSTPASSSGYSSVGYPPSQQPQAQTSQHTLSNHQTSNPPAASSQNPNQTSLPNRINSTIQLVARIAEIARKQQQSLHAKPSNTQVAGSAIASQSLLYGQDNYNQQLIEALGKIQAQQAQQNANLVQQLVQAQQSTASNSSSQMLAAAQQAQQAQTNQILAMMQQYQQNTSTVDPSQYLAQSQPQNEQMMDLLLQAQSNAAPAAGIDWASLASSSGVDINSLVGTMAGGMDPTGLTEGVGSTLMEGVGSSLMGGVSSLFE